MNKRLLSMFLALCMIFTMMPISVLAEEVNNISAGRGEITEFATIAVAGNTFTANITVGEDNEVPCTFKVIEDPSEGNKGKVQIGSGIYEKAAIDNSSKGEILIPTQVYDGDKAYDVTAIGAYAFYKCSELTGDLSIPNTVTSIGKNAFYECSNLDGILSIPNTVTEIGSSAFNWCSKLTGDLIIPDKVTKIEDYTFSGCSGFEGSLIIPDSVTMIGSGAFFRCRGFRGGLTIPDSVTSIGKSAFDECSGFTGGLTIPDSVTSIGELAFWGCSGFDERLIISDSVESIGQGAFCWCEGFTGDLIIPDSVTSIGNAAFRGCNGFNGVLSIPSGVTSIGNFAFASCSKLTGDLTIPASVKSIGDSAFEYCSGLTGSLIIPDSVTSIGEKAFYSCPLKSVTLLRNPAPSVANDSFSGTYKIFYPADATGYTINNWASYKGRIFPDNYTQEPMPNTTFTATGADTGKLTNVTTSMKYSVDGGTNWLPIDDTTINISGVNTEHGVWIKQLGDSTTADSEVQIIAITKAEAPTTVGKTDVTVVGNDGTLTGMSNLMEYKLSTASNYTQATGDTVTGLDAGTYYVRFKGNGTVLASDDKKVIIKGTPTASNLTYSLNSVDYDGNTKPLSVIPAAGKALGEITVKYNGETAVPINAGTYDVSVDIAESATYKGVTLNLGSYTINRIDYSDTTNVVANVLESGEVGATVILPALPTGASYGTPVADGEITLTSMSIGGTTLTYTASKSTAGQTGRMTLPVTGATNYKDYSVVVTVTSTAEQLFTATVTNGTGSGSYAKGTTVTITANDRSGYTFTGWSCADVTFVNANAKTTTFIMPEKSVTVTANYRQNTSGGGGGSVIITPPIADKPNFPTQGEIKVPGIVDSKGNVTVNIADKTVTEAFDKALADAKKNGNEKNGITLVLRIDTGRKSASDVTVNLPKSVQDIIIDKKIVNTIVVVDNPGIRIGMDLITIKEINSQAKSDVNITATRMDSDKLIGDGKKAIGSRPVFDIKVNYGNGKQVQNFGKGNVSVTIPYTLGMKEKAGNICAVYVDGSGKVNWLTNSVYDSAEKVLRFNTNHFSIYGVGYKEDSAPTDILNHWAKNDIEFVISRGLFRDTYTTNFSPNSAITRGLLVTALGRLAKVDVSSYKQSSFTDVKNDSYYMGYIEWANKNNVLKGIGNGKFAPDQSITREELATIMQNYAKAIGFILSKVYEENIFVDNLKISTNAKDAVKQMQMAGIISSKNGNIFDPQGIATRAEVSAVLRRLVEGSISSDIMQGWRINDSGKWMYYENGRFVTGKKDIDGLTYTFDEYGVTAYTSHSLKQTIDNILSLIASKLGLHIE